MVAHDSHLLIVALQDATEANLVHLSEDKNLLAILVSE